MLELRSGNMVEHLLKEHPHHTGRNGVVLSAQFLEWIQVTFPIRAFYLETDHGSRTQCYHATDSKHIRATVELHLSRADYIIVTAEPKSSRDHQYK